MLDVITTFFTQLFPKPQPMPAAEISPDFENEIHFPSFGNLPHEYFKNTNHFSSTGGPNAHWCFLAEIKESIPWPVRPMYHVSDKEGFESLVAFHLEDRRQFPAVSAMCKEGHTICIMYAMQHGFADGQVGVRVEDEQSVKVLPCTLEELFDIRKKIARNGGCNGCGGSATLKCAKCKLFYCNRECQLKDWSAHKTECKVVQQVNEWMEFDWNRFDSPKWFRV